MPSCQVGTVPDVFDASTCENTVLLLRSAMWYHVFGCAFQGGIRVCWADKIALVWAAILWGGMALLANGHGQPADALDINVIKAVLLLAGVPWLFLRVIDFLCGGPMRRSDAKYFRQQRMQRG